MKPRLFFAGILAFVWSCKSDPIRDKPISFSQWRVDETIKYVNSRYDRQVTSLEMLPVMIVSHFTAMEPLDVSFKYLNNEEMESGRSQLRTAGGANIAVQFLVDKNGDIYRLMPENHIGRHVIGLNRHAIGIENVGKNEQSLTAEQVEANALIVRRMAKQFPIKYLIGHSEYREFENTPLWEERDQKYRTEKVDPGESFMRALRDRVKDLGLKSRYDASEVPARLDYVLGGYHKRGLFNGVALVAQNGKVIFEKAYGRADLALNRELRVDDRIYIASAAKPITAAAVAKLVERKKVSYNSGVAEFFPSLAHLLRGVKLKHLLEHSSGLEDYYRLRPGTHWQSNSEVVAALAGQNAPLAPPGKKFHYANSNYVLLAEILEKVSQEKFAAFVRREILSANGMSNTYFRSEISDFDSVAATTETGAEFRYIFLTQGGGGLYATARDLWRFDEAVWARDPSPIAFGNAIRIEGKTEHYGFGAYLTEKRNISFHDGNFNGYHSMNWMDRTGRSGIVLLANKQTSRVKEITYEIDRILHGLRALPLI